MNVFLYYYVHQYYTSPFVFLFVLLYLTFWSDANNSFTFNSNILHNVFLKQTKKYSRTLNMKGPCVKIRLFTSVDELFSLSSMFDSLFPGLIYAKLSKSTAATTTICVCQTFFRVMFKAGVLPTCGEPGSCVLLSLQSWPKKLETVT